MKISLLRYFVFLILICNPLFANDPANEELNNNTVEVDKNDSIEIINLYTEAMTAIKEEQWKTASDNLKKVFSKSPDTPLPYLGFGKFHYAREEYTSSVNALYKGLEVAPFHTELLYEHSRALVMLGDLPYAIEQADKATLNANAKWQHFYWLHHLLKNNNEKTIARINLEIAIERLDFEIQRLKSSEGDEGTKVSSEKLQEAITMLESKRKLLKDELFLIE